MQSTFSIRMDENLKKQFDLLCADLGMNATTAFNIFARTVVREKKIPFEISACPKPQEFGYVALYEDTLKNVLQRICRDAENLSENDSLTTEKPEE
ncbi:MAG: type II toxin-antitoxin system RelB/DinJ family antitoxin [Clostridiales bacterium]|nr:type II toxin-antitoxin system RelB/DinJ family antitoxin [Clostridiales bacterium]